MNQPDAPFACIPDLGIPVNVMIIDSRQIQFSAEAVKEAVKTYRELFPQKQPPGLLGTVSIRGLNPISLGVKVQAVGSRVYREVEMTESEVAAMLILYCRKLKIPLPRSADKAIKVQGDNLSLIVSKTLTVSGPSALVTAD
jgi:hypothetical protein